MELAEEKHRRKMVGNSSFNFVTLTCVMTVRLGGL